MAKSKNYVWIGKGVLRVGKKLIGQNEPIPEAVTDERVKELIALGCIGEKPVEKVKPEKVDEDLKKIVTKQS